jgi:uncharacterized protein (DUF885 family)
MLRFLLATIPGLVLSTSACTVERVGRSPTEPLRQLFEETWAFELAEDPLLATAAGVGDYNDRLPSVALADLERRDRYWREALERLEAVDRGALGAQDRINYDMFRSRLGNRIRDYELGGHLLPLTVDNGFHIAFARLPSQMPMRHADDYQNYISRLRSAPQYFEQYTDLLREGVARGMTLSRVILDGYDVTIATHVVDDAQASVFWAPFERQRGSARHHRVGGARL